MTPYQHIRKIVFVALLPGLMIAVVLVTGSRAQQIDFGKFVPENESAYELVLTKGVAGSPTDLDFGYVIVGQRDVTIDPLTGDDDDDVVVVAIEGVSYLDVYVDITAPDLLVTGSSSNGKTEMPFELKVAYANFGEGNTAPQYRQDITGFSARFPIRRRDDGPPGPPPTPPHDGYTPPRDKAYLFFGGVLDVIQDLVVGDYTGTIVVTVSYEAGI